MAASFRMPVGSPPASRTMVPPGGSSVARVTLASFSASELARHMWPSRRFTNTGFPGVTASINCRVGRRAGVQLSWSQSPPVIQRPLGSFAAKSRMRSRNSASLRASRSCTSARCSPPVRKWTCASLKPGTTSLPPRSTTRVLGPIHLRTSAIVPAAAMREPAHATASACGCRSFTVQILPFSKTKSAAGCAATWLITANTNIAALLTSPLLYGRCEPAA
jgi:hypothetical protein